MKIEVSDHDHLNHSPAFALAAKGWAELVVQGLAPPELTMGYDNKTIVAQIEGRQVGVLVWVNVSDRKEALVVLGYVEPDARRKGVYSALYSRLKEKAREEGLRRISGVTSCRNGPMLVVMEKLGRRPVAIHYEEQI